jgi:hypothetical protein
MAEVLRLLGKKLSSGVITREEHDAILAAHIASTRPESWGSEEAADCDSTDGAGPAVPPPKSQQSVSCVPSLPARATIHLRANGRCDLFTFDPRR